MQSENTAVDLLFSPFDALGLVPKQDYHHDTLREAYRTKSLETHPDKNPGRTRWPLFAHVRTAYERLRLNQEAAYAQYASYPVTFDSANRDDELQEKYRAIFQRCTHCGMPVRKTRINSHLKDHRCWVCNICLEETFLEDRSQHQSNHHPGDQCPRCSEYTPNLIAHVKARHHCPLCKQTLAHSSLLDHVHGDHSLEPCKKCYEYHDEWTEDLATHVKNEHLWLWCDMCGTHCEMERFITHLKEIHRINCKSCTFRTGAALSNHVRESHQCPFCGGHVTTVELNQHILDDHLFEPCPECPYLDFSEQARLKFVQHAAEDHAYSTCTDCQAEIVLESMERHKTEHHGWLKCNVCGILIPPEDFDKHLHLESHGRTKGYVMVSTKRQMLLE